MKMGVNKIENQGDNWYKMLEYAQWQILLKNRNSFRYNYLRTKCDRDNLIFSAEKGGQ